MFVEGLLFVCHHLDTDTTTQNKEDMVRDKKKKIKKYFLKIK